jgi:acetolactate synthase-1/2/3 large subunit
MTRAEFLLRGLRDQGLGHVFLVPGGHIDPLVAELGKGAGLQPIVAAHEEGAEFVADGYARVSSRSPLGMRVRRRLLLSPVHVRGR